MSLHPGVLVIWDLSCIGPTGFWCLRLESLFTPHLTSLLCAQNPGWEESLRGSLRLLCLTLSLKHSFSFLALKAKSTYLKKIQSNSEINKAGGEETPIIAQPETQSILIGCHFFFRTPSHSATFILYRDYMLFHVTVPCSSFLTKFLHSHHVAALLFIFVVRRGCLAL